jgi:hypothetical protein
MSRGRNILFRSRNSLWISYCFNRWCMSWAPVNLNKSLSLTQLEHRLDRRAWESVHRLICAGEDNAWMTNYTRGLNRRMKYQGTGWLFQRRCLEKKSWISPPVEPAVLSHNTSVNLWTKLHVSWREEAQVKPTMGAVNAGQFWPRTRLQQVVHAI